MIDVKHGKSIEAVLNYIRPAVRRERPYHVGGVPNVHIKLNQNESPLDVPEALKEDLLKAFMAIPFNRYPTEQPDELRYALGAYVGHDPEGILVGNGSNELTYTLGLTMVDRGTPVVMPRPMFALYETVIRLYEGKLTSVPPLPDLHFDVQGLLTAVQQTRPVLTVLTSPNNPTGLAMSLADIERIVVAAPGFVLVDEAYVEFNEEESAQTLMAQYPNVLILRTLSKAFGLAGLRIGYLMGQPAVIAELLKARLPFMVDRLAQAVAMAFLQRPALLQERATLMKTGLQHLQTAMGAMDGVEVVPSQANFLLFKTETENEVVMARLAEKGVLVRNMGGYPELRGYLRVNAGTPDENKAFLAALKVALQ